MMRCAGRPRAWPRATPRRAGHAPPAETRLRNAPEADPVYGLVYGSRRRARALARRAQRVALAGRFRSDFGKVLDGVHLHAII
jgi:hypothetical protein